MSRFMGVFSVTSNFEYALALTLGFEGGFTVDTGGPTNLGVTQDTLDRWCRLKNIPRLDVRDLTVPIAKQVYFDLYWTVAGCDKIENKFIAAELFESCVNCGPGRAIIFAQEAVNAVLAHDGLRISEDGQIGPVTIGALNKAVRDGHFRSLVCYMNVVQGGFYLSLVRQDSAKFGKYVNGWYKRVCLMPDVMKEVA